MTQKCELGQQCQMPTFATVYGGHETKKCFNCKAENLRIVQVQKQPSRVRTRPILARGPRARACNAARKAGEDDILEAGHWIDQEFMEDLVGKEEDRSPAKPWADKLDQYRWP
ncbi:hypothetical protein N7509_010238 [Penicillium cosmopolitanum]|uniref:Uncharacterized protein n=1 Tax=Penicillium cosmopolitanum TaxID=1131564 RepID=A0A9X0B4E5_9EURO|nr:uncharacterized protein N7509_010238 [Penicillium cosmopolitanum]KAJ5387697.1 hypothetical protein N7509_010238 [Penicillium cosmopolitanum]